MISGDENITYPYVVNMLEPATDIHDQWWRLIIYGDYHYGYRSTWLFLESAAAAPG